MPHTAARPHPLRQARAEEVEREVEELRRAVRAAETRVAAVEREAEVANRAAVAAIEEEQRLRLDEQRLRLEEGASAARALREGKEAADGELAALQARLEGEIDEVKTALEMERGRRREAAKMAIVAEAAQREATAGEHRRRLQLENAARLERTARRDLAEERELIRSLLEKPAREGHEVWPPSAEGSGVHPGGVNSGVHPGGGAWVGRGATCREGQSSQGSAVRHQGQAQQSEGPWPAEQEAEQEVEVEPENVEVGIRRDGAGSGIRGGGATADGDAAGGDSTPASSLTPAWCCRPSSLSAAAKLTPPAARVYSVHRLPSVMPEMPAEMPESLNSSPTRRELPSTSLFDTDSFDEARSALLRQRASQSNADADAERCGPRAPAAGDGDSAGRGVIAPSASATQPRQLGALEALSRSSSAAAAYVATCLQEAYGPGGARHHTAPEPAGDIFATPVSTAGPVAATACSDSLPPSRPAAALPSPRSQQMSGRSDAFWSARSECTAASHHSACCAPSAEAEYQGPEPRSAGSDGSPTTWPREDLSPRLSDADSPAALKPPAAAAPVPILSPRTRAAASSLRAGCGGGSPRHASCATITSPRAPAASTRLPLAHGQAAQRSPRDAPAHRPSPLAKHSSAAHAKAATASRSAPSDKGAAASPLLRGAVASGGAPLSSKASSSTRSAAASSVASPQTSSIPSPRGAPPRSAPSMTGSATPSPKLVKKGSFGSAAAAAGSRLPPALDVGKR